MLEITPWRAAPALTGIEHLVGSEHNDTLAGDGEDNILEGRNGDDALGGGPYPFPGTRQRPLPIVQSHLS